MSKHQFVKVQGKRFVGEEVGLDGHDFIDCIFVDCTYRFEGRAPFKFNMGSRISGSFDFVGDQHLVNALIAGMMFMKVAFSSSEKPFHVKSRAMEPVDLALLKRFN